jgi:hypothetical protein
MKRRVQADFNDMIGKGRVRIQGLELERSGISAEQGCQVLLVCDEFEVDGTLAFEVREGVWVGVFDPNTIRYYNST